MEQVRQLLRQFISDSFLFGRSDAMLSDMDSLVEGGVIDSTGVLLLVAFLEEHFAIQVLDEEIVPDNLDSIDALVRYLARKRACALPHPGHPPALTLGAAAVAEAAVR